jgi:hypothetical protein
MAYFLRTNKHSSGFYKKLNNGKLLELKTPLCRFLRPKYDQRADKPILKELRWLNTLILKNLTCSSTKSPVIRCKMEPSEKFSRYLSEKYSIKNKFTNGTEFLMDHSFEIERFYNQTDYCTIFIKNDGLLSFSLKLANPRKLVHLNRNLEKIETFYKIILHIEFNVHDKKIDFE